MTKHKKSGEWDYYDDCAICSATRKAEEAGKDLSFEELKDAFDQANREQTKRKS